MRVKLGRELAQVAERLGRHRLEGADVLLDLAVGGAGLQRHFVHGGDEVGHAVDQRALDLAHVLMRAAQHLLQEDVGLAQPLEQRGGVRSEHAVGFQHLRHGRAAVDFDCSTAA